MKKEIKERIEMINNGEVPEGYKETKLGIIPEEWEIGKISSFLKIKYGKSQKKIEKENGKYPILGTGGQIGRSDEYLYGGPSVLIGRKGTINKPFYINKPFWTIDTLFYSEINDIKANPRWIYYYFNIINWLKFNEATGVPSLKASVIENVKLKYPTINEQTQIVNILQTWDKAIELKENLLEKKKDIKKGLMQNLLTGEVRLEGFDDEWEEVELGNITNISTGNKDTKDKNDNGKYPFYVRSATIERIDSYSYDGEAILIPGDGKIGEIYHYINGKFDYHQRVYKISDFSSKCIGKFIYSYLDFFFIREALKYTAKATVDSLRMYMLKDMKMKLPSLNEQKAIANILSKSDESIELLEKEIKSLREQKKGLMQLLLTGKVRVNEMN